MHVPPFQQPVQGSCPEGIRYPFTHSSRKVASGQFSHQYPRFRIARPHPIHTPLPSHSYSDFPPLSYSTARDQSPHIILIIRSTATRITDPFQEPTPQGFPLPQWGPGARAQATAISARAQGSGQWGASTRAAGNRCEGTFSECKGASGGTGSEQRWGRAPGCR
jgi:hypothetical protein